MSYCHSRKIRIRPKSLLFIALFFSQIIVSMGIHAADFSMNGRIDVNNTHKVHALSETHIIVLATMDETIVLDDESSPSHGATGSCSGAIEIKNENVNGNGLCTFTDAEDDSYVISWVVNALNEKGGPMGDWQATGGTGKYANATASGKFDDVPTDDPSKSVITLTGNLKMP